MPNLYQRCVRFVSDILSFVMSTGNDTAPDVDPEIPAILSGKNRGIPQRVGTWHCLVHNCYDSPEHAHKTRVTRISWYKCRKGLNHEYAVATVTRGKSTYFIRIERYASDEKQLDGDVVDDEEIPEDRRQQLKLDVQHERSRASKANPLTNNSINTRKSIASSNMREDNRALDVALHVDAENGAIDNEEVYLLATYHYNSATTPLYLRDLVFILNHINDSHPSFKLLLTQCYWFVRTFIGVANKLYNPEINEKPNFNLAGHYTQAMATFRVPVNKDSPVEIDRYAEAVRKQIEAHDQYLHEKWMRGAGGKEVADERARQADERARQADQNAMEERRRREEADQNAMEERKRREEADQKAMEERKRREEAEAQLYQLQASRAASTSANAE
ncbi:hypothetical protein D9613_007062 [Agrocybe pediades]|uniref:Uncharacterized protein n=1 Tax=Agrocybe pediades TaxID=84607 RepID=A0A8H4VIH7_9AGAR|nr:hypothetical protein D9613_007062 [Agrocybe pediades]